LFQKSYPSDFFCSQRTFETVHYWFSCPISAIRGGDLTLLVDLNVFVSISKVQVS